jgi:hypothetical protein
MTKKQKIIISLLILVFIVVTGALIYFLKDKTDDNLILNKDPWKNVNPKIPFYTPPLEPNQIPKKAITIFASKDKCSPLSFTVNKNDNVILILKSDSPNQNILSFNDENLELVKIITDGKQVRGILFQAPANSGKYTFTCGDAQQKNKSSGVMIVK